MKSKITGGATEKIFSKTFLDKYEVSYFRCKDTGFIQTEEPYWLEEAYSAAISKLDIGLIFRNEELRNETVKIISSYFNGDKRFLDYAGGYGMFTRMMRDKGYDFYHTDIYCQNLFAENFDLKVSLQKNNFEVVTAFEVFEHLVNPVEEISKIATLGDNILFSTLLQPEGMENLLSWWYLIPEVGQHISLYTKESLNFLAKELGFHFYSNGVGTHLFTKKKLSSDPFEKKTEPYLIRTMRRKVNRFDHKNSPQRETLLLKDFDEIQAKIRRDSK